MERAFQVEFLSSTELAEEGSRPREEGLEKGCPHSASCPLPQQQLEAVQSFFYPPSLSVNRKMLPFCKVIFQEAPTVFVSSSLKRESGF